MFELYLLTFNCARQLIDADALAPVLFDALPQSAKVPDLVAVSLQEISPIAYSFLGGSYLTPYFERATTAVQQAALLRSKGNEQLEHIATRSLGMSALMIFAKPHFSPRIRWIQSAGAGVGLWDMGNKGAVAMRLGLSCPGTDEEFCMTFAAAHLAPHEPEFEARNSDWEALVRNMVFTNDDKSDYLSGEAAPLLSASTDAPAEGDGLFIPGNHALFLAGDLNYRTSDKRPEADAYKFYPSYHPSDLSYENYSHLLGQDQLTREREANRTFHHLEELPINFPPTYKYTQSRTKHPDGTEEEEWRFAKHRWPSWCDRILFQAAPSGPRLKPQIYNVLPVQHTSDHRPVGLSIEVDDAVRAVAAGDDGHPAAPFPINPNWRTRRDTARRLEVLVGVLSYLALTKQGNAILVAAAGAIGATWWLIATLSSS
jgi:endonuclease/exonuclease/phosphatase family metal-dependent hydrolase